MKTTKKFLTVALAAAIALPFSLFARVPDAEAQTVFLEKAGIFHAIGAVSTDVGILIKYVGSSPAGGTVAVAAGGDITLATGAVGASSADLTTECPVSGALGGVIDVSDAACNTLGEVVDAINASANWRAVIVDGLATDSSDNTLITLSEANAATPKGIGLLKDTTVALNVSLALIPYEMRTDIRQYLDNAQPPSFIPNPYAASQFALYRANGTFTGTGADNFDYYSLKERYAKCGPAAASTAASIICSQDSEVVTAQYTEPGGGTTVNKSYDFTHQGFPARPGEKALVRLRAATTFTAATFSVGGYGFQPRARP